MIKISSEVIGIENLNEFDWKANRKLVVEAVILKGWPDDFEALFTLYGKDEIIETIKEIKYFPEPDIPFISAVFNIGPGEINFHPRENETDQ